jgi:hypothetical protein
MNETIAATMKMFEDAIRRRRAAVPAREEEGTNAKPVAGQLTKATYSATKGPTGPTPTR